VVCAELISLLVEGVVLLVDGLEDDPAAPD
jgi:hypothetical protein